MVDEVEGINGTDEIQPCWKQISIFEAETYGKMKPTMITMATQESSSSVFTSSQLWVVSASTRSSHGFPEPNPDHCWDAMLNW